MEKTSRLDNNEEVFSSLDYIRNLFVRSEDSLALKGLDLVLQKLEIASQKIPIPEQDMFQQLLTSALMCLETKDYVRLMDILIFEIQPLLNS